jgi:lysophospholipase L1-like esterase
MQTAIRTRTAHPALMDARWRRLLLLWLLSPLLWLQARHLPEPPGSRSGSAGCGSLVRLLVAGDSGAAGVGAATQEQALCGQLVQRLSQHHTVEWCVLAANGLDSPGLLKLLQEAPSARFDVVVLSMGANDATALCAPLQWARWQSRLAELIALRFSPDLLVHSAVPPMHACKALPQPLRWFMGHWARQMNQSLAALLIEQEVRTLHWHPASTTTAGMSADGIHPSANGYALWAEGLSHHILAAKPLKASTPTAAQTIPERGTLGCGVPTRRARWHLTPPGRARTWLATTGRTRHPASPR